MSLAQKINLLQPSAPGLPCGIAKILESASQDDRTALELVMATKAEKGSISNRQIYALLLSEGYDIAFSSVRLHRSKHCRCFVGKNGKLRAVLHIEDGDTN
jgi:hypothetical protein